MCRHIFIHLILLFIISSFPFLSTCSDESENPDENGDVWDIDKKGIPKFVDVNYIELDKIYRISKFRSAIGHDYSDAFEDCRSMKHYFEPKADIDWSSVKIYVPVTGKITRVEQEWAGTKIEIVSDDYPAFRFSIFHVFSSESRNIDDKVTAGDQLGTHIGNYTMSDIAVIVNDPTKQGRMISYFEVMTDVLFESYLTDGINARQDFIISRELRDSHPLTCDGETFTSVDSLENWIYLSALLFSDN